MVVRLIVSGGLGNQLYSYAFAHFLEAELDEEIVLTYVLDKRSRVDRPIELSPFIRECDHRIRIDINNQIGFLLRFIDKLRTYKLFNKYRFTKITKILEFDSNAEVPPLDILRQSLTTRPRIIRGFLQNTQIVDYVWQDLSRELNAVREKMELILEVRGLQNFTAVHLRRGDTVSFGESHGILEPKFYLDSINREMNLVVCYDDDGYQEIFKSVFDKAVLIGPKQASALETFQILCGARAFVGANSTLSWWAAYINSKEKGNKCILPSPWNKRQGIDGSQIRISNVEYKKAIFEAK